MKAAGRIVSLGRVSTASRTPSRRAAAKGTNAGRKCNNVLISAPIFSALVPNGRGDSPGASVLDTVVKEAQF